MNDVRVFRPTTVEQMAEKLDLFFTEQGVAKGLQFQPRADDVLIATYPKCGTTWMQQIVHGLRTTGSMEFSEITQVTPWIEAAFDLDWDLEAEQVGTPRACLNSCARNSRTLDLSTARPSAPRQYGVLPPPFSCISQRFPLKHPSNTEIARPSP